MLNNYLEDLNAKFKSSDMEDIKTFHDMETEIARELMTSSDKFRNSAKEFTEKYGSKA